MKGPLKPQQKVSSAAFVRADVDLMRFGLKHFFDLLHTFLSMHFVVGCTPFDALIRSNGVSEPAGCAM